MTAEQQIAQILSAYSEPERRDILEAAAIRLGYTCTFVADGEIDDDDDDDDDDNIAPWG